ncbi:Zinc carboxypeptidase [Rubripirellula obstinata]|uniref:Zinc carboxypeptidase n=1 Tax=Rubripirellula obstinata TaxID=406547 RepID=A0A5B1CQ68_9BACT|nr:M14-type cytosolic carboxypeptidase [Rubripirellula obstinata]KAA1262542.1 Zinc carboxypeptidase [Rubripirellula obstinata]
MSKPLVTSRRRASLFLSLMLGMSLTGINHAWADPRELTQTDVAFESLDKTVSFQTDFPGGKIDRLVERGSDEFEIVIKPEVEPINDSAWYAFRVQSTDTQEIDIRLRYEGGSHRYAPKISHDRKTWKSADQMIVARHPGGREVTLRVPVSEKALWVSGQEIVSNRDIKNWISTLAEKPYVDDNVIGESVQGQPLYQMQIGNEDARDSIFILSRQHPPEVTGTIGMMHFVEVLSADTKLAKRFREKFLTVVVPIANPDGVEHGYWRANANGVDLNRDWQHFTQPETAAIRNELVRLTERENGRPWLFLDFHSTYNELFYTAPQENDLFPRGFTKQWLAAIDKRMPSFDVLRDDAHNAHRATSKSWVARELGIHAITYEFGDETERERIREIAEASAKEMMKLLLKFKEVDAS